MSRSLFPWLISLIAILLIVLRIIFPQLPIDVVTIFLFAFALFPWFYPLLKSFAWGNLSIEFKELEDVAEQARHAGLLNSHQQKKTDKVSDTFRQIYNQDPNLSLTGLRIEIEKKLRLIAQKNEQGEEQVQYLKIRELLSYLTRYELISFQERGILDDLISVLNRASHGADIDVKAREWAMQIGISILASLQVRLEERSPKKRPSTKSKTI